MVQFKLWRLENNLGVVWVTQVTQVYVILKHTKRSFQIDDKIKVILYPFDISAFLTDSNCISDWSTWTFEVDRSDRQQQCGGHCNLNSLGLCHCIFLVQVIYFRVLMVKPISNFNLLTYELRFSTMSIMYTSIIQSKIYC